MVYPDSEAESMIGVPTVKLVPGWKSLPSGLVPVPVVVDDTGVADAEIRVAAPPMKMAPPMATVPTAPTRSRRPKLDLAA